jgi:hypothetical protein
MSWSPPSISSLQEEKPTSPGSWPSSGWRKPGSSFHRVSKVVFGWPVAVSREASIRIWATCWRKKRQKRGPESRLALRARALSLISRIDIG